VSSKQQQWRDHMAAAKDFSGSIESYCRSKGITPSAFYYWKKRLCETSARSIVPAVSSFVPVEVVRGQRPSSGLPDPKWVAEFVIHLTGGVR